jgi:hypothetical protein
LQENKSTKCKTHCPQGFTTHHHQLLKILLSFAFDD